MQLAGRTVVVTGGAVRLGRAIALRLAEARMNVVLHYFHSADEAAKTLEDIRQQGVEAVGVQADLSDSERAAEQIIEQAVAAFGPPDVLINNAGLFEAGTLAEVTEDQWQRNFSINLKAPLFLCREFARALPSEGRGQIVHIADWRGTRPDPDHLVYALTKSGLVKLTRDLAVGLAPRVQVNAVAPGAVLPPAGQGEDALQRLRQVICLGRVGSPEDVCDAVLYLLASDFVTGEVIHVTGGQQL